MPTPHINLLTACMACCNCADDCAKTTPNAAARQHRSSQGLSPYACMLLVPWRLLAPTSDHLQT